MPDIPREGELWNEATHVYEADLAVGRSWRLEVTTANNEALVKLAGETHAGETHAGETQWLLTARTLYGLGWSEVLVWTGTITGTTRITISGVKPGAPVGPYQLVLKPVAASTPRDRRAFLAEQLLTESAEFHTRGTVDLSGDPRASKASLERAVAALEDALPHWRELGRRRDELRTLIYLSEMWLSLGKPADAARSLAVALPLASQPEDASTRALLLDRLGFVLLRQGDLERAHRSLEQARDLWQNQGPSRGEVQTRTTLCLLHLRRGEWNAARQCYEELLTLHHAAEQRLEARLRNSLGGVYANLGEPDLAISCYRQALALSQALGDAESEAQTRNNLGALHRALGEPEEGVAHYLQALASFRRRGDHHWQARTLNNLGYAYLTLGDLERARTFFRDALELRRQAGDRRGEAVTLRNLGRVAARQGHLVTAAEAHAEALAIARAIGDRRGEARALHLLATVRNAQHEFGAAREPLGSALEIRRDLGDRPGIAAVLLAQGEARLGTGEATAAKDSFEEALKLYRAIRDPVGETETHYGLARAARRRGRPGEARRHLETALAMVESLRVRILDPSQRASFLAAKRGVFELLIDTLMDLHHADPAAGHDRAALVVSERARARTLLDFLEEPAADLDRSIAPELRQRLRIARRRLDAKVQRQLQVLGRRSIEAEAAVAESEVHEALTEFEIVRAEILRASPRFAALSEPEPLEVTEIQNLLDPETALLEIALGRERGFLWLVTSDAVASFELPARAPTEALARQVYQELSQFELGIRGSRGEAARELARWILAPVAQRLTGRRILVVPDGALHYVPFATLPIPVEGDSGATIPLLERWEVVHLPSASALARQRRLLATRPPAAKTAAVLADPIFDTLDSRLSTTPSSRESPVLGETSPAATRGGLLRGFRQLGITGFDRLPQTRQEALSIAALAPEGQILTLLGFDASREKVLSSELDDYRILHFATHGLLHPRTPELSGLMLSQVDAEGRLQDGFLRLHDLLGLELGADLIVLSGCQTALGKEVRGEGFVGLARGFFYAGAPRVVASLWQVQDQATAELMTHFYRGVLKEGKPAATAMRAAQLAIRDHRRWRDPFFWGAFLFQGDWR